MRVKSYKAQNMAEAMNQVRAELGEDAIILSTQNEDDGTATVTAAIEQAEPVPPVQEKKNWAADWDADWKSAPAERKAVKAKAPEGQTIVKPQKSKPKQIMLPKKLEPVIKSLAYHGVPTQLGERLCRGALKTNTDDSVLALAAAIDQHFHFSAVETKNNRPTMLIGPAGVGKTMTVAKMAAAAKLSKSSVAVITTDFTRAGAIDQLKAFTDILEIELHTAKDASELKSKVTKLSKNSNDRILIDTGGINPYDMSDLEEMTAQIVAVNADPAVDLAAGTDSAEMSDTAKVFAAVGATKIMVTRLDTTRRYGGLLTAASNANLGFSYASVSPAVATGLHTLTPVNLARLILRDPLQSDISNEFSKASR